MRYRYDGELRQRAERFVEALARAGIEGAIMPGSFREYSVKVAISRGGHSFGPAIIYYSPKKDSLTMKTHELKDGSIAPELQACWDRPTTPVSAPTGYQIYVDGSYLEEAVGYGLVVLKDGLVVDELCGPVEEETVQGMRQVAGELRAVYEAVAWCREHGVSEISLFYDYEGIEKWATGEWTANKPATRAYAQAAGDWPIDVHWHKVTSHTGDRWNDYADRLAKQGARRHQAIVQEEQDPLTEVQHKASEFVEFLLQHDITASFQGLINGQFARVVVGAKQGFLDVYNTRKRSISEPYLHSFRDSSLQSQVEILWRKFLLENGEARLEEDDSLERVSYYYEILHSYRDCEFDFVDLARALHNAYDQRKRLRIDVEAIRYDFGTLEALYLDLKREEK